MTRDQGRPGLSSLVPSSCVHHLPLPASSHRRYRRRMVRVGATGAALLLAVAWATVAVGQPTVSDGTLTVDTVLTQLAAPSSMAFLAANDFLFLEKNSGRVRRVVGGVLQANPVLDVAVNND